MEEYALPVLQDGFADSRMVLESLIWMLSVEEAAVRTHAELEEQGVEEHRNENRR
jgi:hypothetical protein